MRFHVAVDQAARMDSREGTRDAQGDPPRLAGIQASPRPEQRVQVAALEQLHHDEGPPLVLADVENSHDGGISQ